MTSSTITRDVGCMPPHRSRVEPGRGLLPTTVIGAGTGSISHSRNAHRTQRTARVQDRGNLLRRSPTFAIGSLTLAVVHVLAEGVSTRSNAAEARPVISVKASPGLAYLPARIVVHAELKGGAVDYEPFYCPTVVWDWGDGTTSENVADCEPYEPGKSKIRRHYSSVHTYSVTGRFDVRFTMTRGDRVLGGAARSVLIRPPLRMFVETPP